MHEYLFFNKGLCVSIPNQLLTKENCESLVKLDVPKKLILTTMAEVGFSGDICMINDFVILRWILQLWINWYNLIKANQIKAVFYLRLTIFSLARATYCQ